MLLSPDKQLLVFFTGCLFLSLSFHKHSRLSFHSARLDSVRVNVSFASGLPGGTPNFNGYLETVKQRLECTVTVVSLQIMSKGA